MHVIPGSRIAAAAAVAVGLLATAPACRTRSVTTRPAADPGSSGSLYLYLAPVPETAARLTIRLRAIAAVRSDGSRLPLEPAIHRVGGAGTRHERRLAGGALPPGSYTGLALTVDSAELRRPDERADLRVPDTPVEVAAPFRVAARRAVVLVLALDPWASVRDGVRLEPVVDATPAPTLAIGLLGLATARRSDTVTLFDKVSGRVGAVIPTGRGPSGIALDARRTRAYVSLEADDAVEEIDLQELRIVNRVRLAGGDRPVEVALSPDGRTLLTANRGSNTVSFVDTRAVIETGRARVGDAPRAVLVGPGGRRAFALNGASSTVSVLDVPRRVVTGTIAVDAAPLQGRLDGRGERLWVIHEHAPYVTVIDTAALRVDRRVYVGSAATAIKVDPRTDRVYLARRGAVDVYDPMSQLPLETIPTEGAAVHVTIDDEGSRLLLVEPDAGQVRTVGIVSRKTIARTDVGDGAHRAALMGER